MYVCVYLCNRTDWPIDMSFSVLTVDVERHVYVGGVDEEWVELSERLK